MQTVFRYFVVRGTCKPEIMACSCDCAYTLCNRVKDEWRKFDNSVRSASPDRLSAIAIFLVLLAVSITCTFTSYLMSSQPERFPTYIAQGCIIAFESLAIICLWWFICCNCCNIRTPEDVQPRRIFTLNNLITIVKLVSMFGFFTAILSLDVYRLLAERMCMDAWTACSSRVIAGEHETNQVYSGVRIAYILSEFIFCCTFKKTTCQNTSKLVALAIVQAANLSCWLDALLDESLVFSPGRNWTYELSLCFNGTHVNASDHFVQCFSHTSPEYKDLESKSPYLYPFIMEYLMLATEYVAPVSYTHLTLPTNREV